MTDLGFDNLLIVTAIAFAAPFALGLVPALRVPAVVVELVAGIVVGPALLGWVEIDEPIEVLSLIGLAFLLFLAGLEIDVRELGGRALRLAGLAWAASFALAAIAGGVLQATGTVKSALLVAILLSATSLGVVVPVLKDAGHVATPFGQLVVAAGTVADFGAILLLSLFFSGQGGVGGTLALVAALVLVATVVLVAVRGAGHTRAVMGVLTRLQDTTAQIRVRGAVVLLIGFVALAQSFGLEAILGAFAAGVLLGLVDRDEAMNHPLFRTKLDAAGYGVFVPVFFVTSGLRFDLDALTGSVGTLLLVPIFLVVLLAVRGLPALLYRAVASPREQLVAGLLQATSLPFIVAASTIGVQLDLLDGGKAAALVAAGLLSVLFFPALALVLLQPTPTPETP